MAAKSAASSEDGAASSWRRRRPVGSTGLQSSRHMAWTKPRSLWTRATFLRRVGVNLRKTAAAARTYCVRAGSASTAESVASQCASGGSRKASDGETRSSRGAAVATTRPWARASASICARTSTCVCVAATKSRNGPAAATNATALRRSFSGESGEHSFSLSAANAKASSNVNGRTSTKAPYDSASRFVSSHSARCEPRFDDSGATTKTTHFGGCAASSVANGATSTPSYLTVPRRWRDSENDELFFLSAAFAAAARGDDTTACSACCCCCCEDDGSDATSLSSLPKERRTERPVAAWSTLPTRRRSVLPGGCFATTLRDDVVVVVVVATRSFWAFFCHCVSL
mmetsp:Transcript_9914/g.30037  ORF Transcript_9914/g.30037 Transcript_9914/m.30037 type:complete len:343 (+) Transcript_9914:636-1664(+)